MIKHPVARIKNKHPVAWIKKGVSISPLLLISVGKTRLELATTRPPDAYANQLRYFPIP